MVLVRPWTAMAWAPAASTAWASSTTLMLPRSQPSRHFTVTGNRDSMGHGFHNPGGQRNVLHESRAVAVTDHLGHGTAHVDVNEVTAGNLHGQSCPLGHYFGIIAKNLSSYHRAFVFPQKPGALPVPVHQGPGGYHLRYCEAGAHSGAYRFETPSPSLRPWAPGPGGREWLNFQFSEGNTSVFLHESIISWGRKNRKLRERPCRKMGILL